MFLILLFLIYGASLADAQSWEISFFYNDDDYNLEFAATEPPNVGDIVSLELKDSAVKHSENGNQRVGLYFQDLDALCDIYFNGEKIGYKVNLCSFPKVGRSSAGFYGRSGLITEYSGDFSVDGTWAAECRIEEVWDHEDLNSYLAKNYKSIPGLKCFIDKEITYEQEFYYDNNSFIESNKYTPFWYYYQPSLRFPAKIYSLLTFTQALSDVSTVVLAFPIIDNKCISLPPLLFSTLKTNYYLWSFAFIDKLEKKYIIASLNTLRTSLRLSESVISCVNY